MFLISGGGNDILGDYRLAQLVTQRANITSHTINLDTHEGKIEFSELALNKEFASLMHLLKIQYILLFESIAIKTGDTNNKFKNLKIITQGYDYAIPSANLGFGFFRAITNKIMGNGKWLKTPLIMRGYNSQKERVAIIHGMMEEFNKMLIEVGEKYLPKQFEGEAILTLGRAELFIKKNGAKAIVNASPMFCMPGTITSSIFPKLEQDLGVPVICNFYDGSGDPNSSLIPCMHYLCDEGK